MPAVAARRRELRPAGGLAGPRFNCGRRRQPGYPEAASELTRAGLVYARSSIHRRWMAMLQLCAATPPTGAGTLRRISRPGPHRARLVLADGPVAAQAHCSAGFRARSGDAASARQARAARYASDREPTTIFSRSAGSSASPGAYQTYYAGFVWRGGRVRNGAEAAGGELEHATILSRRPGPGRAAPPPVPVPRPDLAVALAAGCAWTPRSAALARAGPAAGRSHAFSAVAWPWPAGTCPAGLPRLGQAPRPERSAGRSPRRTRTPA